MTNELGKRTCYFVDESMVSKHDDGTYHFYPGIVTEDVPGYLRTDYDYGTYFKAAQSAVENLNADLGYTKADTQEIVCSSMFATSRGQS